MNKVIYLFIYWIAIIGYEGELTLNKSHSFVVQSLGKKPLNLTPQHQTICCFYEIKSLTARVSNTHTILLIDKSSSMTSTLEEVKELIYHTVQALKINASHKLSILLFGNEEDLQWLIFRESAKEVVSQLEGIHCFLEQWFGDEFTHLSRALEITFQAVEGIKDEKERQQVIIISDGHLYTKNQSLMVEQSRCYGWMLDFAMKQIPVYLVGIGDYDLDFLVQLAQTTSLGDFYPYVDSKTYIRYFKCWLRLLKTQVNHDLIINNESYFLMSQTLHIHHPKRLPMLASIPQYIVIFDEVLNLNGDSYPVSEEVTCEELQQRFKWAYTYYLLKQKHVNEAAYLQEDNYLFQLINEGYSHTEISQSLNALNHCRYGKKTGQLSHVNTKQRPSVLELLEMILDDPFSNLLWPSSSTISKIIGETHTFETNLNAFFSVKNIKISTKKQNITFHVKVEGVSRQHGSKLKLDCHIYREYFFIKNGNLKQRVLFCQLSSKLKQKMKNWCLLLPSFNQKVDIINLEPLKLTHLPLFSLNQDEIVAKKLYELEQLNIRIQVLKTLLKKERLNDNLQSPDSLSMRKVRKSYQVNASGVFEGDTHKQKSIRSDRQSQEVIEWKIENFPTQAQWNECYENIQKQLLTIPEVSSNTLVDWFYETKEKRLKLQNKIYLLRLQSELCQQKIFHWDEVQEKEIKSDTHQRSTRKIICSKKTIDELIIFEYRYRTYSS